MKKIGALEAGGTKMLLAVYTEKGNPIAHLELPTLSPVETLPAMVQFFRSYAVDALGIGSFGPLDLNPTSLTYGWITSTPKIAWQNTPLLHALLDGLDIPAAIDTDVNTALLAEVSMGAARGCKNAVYITIGTGIGGGVFANGQTVRGLMHPEVGHMLIRPHPDDPNPRGICPFHESCLEGLASGPAIAARTGCDARALPNNHQSFEIEAYYLAQMCHNLIMTMSPERILLGGGVMKRDALLPMVRKETKRLLSGYIQSVHLSEKIDEYIVAPSLFPESGLVGAYLLGKRALSGNASAC